MKKKKEFSVGDTVFLVYLEAEYIRGKFNKFLRYDIKEEVIIKKTITEFMSRHKIPKFVRSVRYDTSKRSNLFEKYGVIGRTEKEAIDLAELHMKNQKM